MPPSTAFSTFLYDQLFRSLPYPTTKHTGQTIIVTGSNIGLGLEAARHFVRLDAGKVILAVRTPEKGEAAKQSIEESTGRKGVLQVWPLDQGSCDSVKDFVKRVQGLESLDIIVENTGMLTHTFRLLEVDESTVILNVVSTFLLALMILPKLRDTANKLNVLPQLVIISSNTHGWAKFPSVEENQNISEYLGDEQSADMSKRYELSKLIQILYLRELCAKQAQPRVVINIVNPGLCKSGISRESTCVDYVFAVIAFLIARSTEVGSRTEVQAASAGMESHGQYLDNCFIRE